MEESVLKSLRYAVENRIPSDNVIPIYARKLPGVKHIADMAFTDVKNVLDMSETYYRNLENILELHPFVRDDYVKYEYYLNTGDTHKERELAMNDQNVAATKNSIDSIQESINKRLKSDILDLQRWERILDIFRVLPKPSAGATIFKYGVLESTISSDVDFYNLFNILNPSEICPFVRLSSGPKRIYSVHNPITTQLSGIHTLNSLYAMMVKAQDNVKFPEDKNKFIQLHKTILNAVIWVDYGTGSRFKNSYQPLTISSAIPSITQNYVKFKKSKHEERRMLSRRTYLTMPIISSSTTNTGILDKLGIGNIFNNLALRHVKCVFEVLNCKFDRYSFELFINDHYSDLIWTKDIDSSGWEKVRHSYLYNIISNKHLAQNKDEKVSVLSFSIKNHLQIGRRKVRGLTESFIVEHQSVYQTIRVTKCYDLVVYRHFKEFILRLFSHYQSKLDEVRDEIRTMISGYDEVLEIERKMFIQRSVDKKSTFTKLMQLKELSGIVFPPGYPKICHSDKQPIPIFMDEINDWKDETFLDKERNTTSRQVLDYKIIPISFSVSRSLTKIDMLFVCPSDIYPYPGVKYNKMYSGPNDARYFPCCFQRDQMDESSDSLFNIVRGKIVRLRKEPTEIIRSSRVLSPRRIGIISDELSSLFRLTGRETYYRIGVMNDNNSLINACLMIVDRKDNPLDIRKDMVNHLSLIGQETYDMDEESVRQMILDGESLNPLIFSRILEILFEINIFLFSSTDLYVPRSSTFYIKPRNYDRSACLMYYPPFETNLTHHCEPIVMLKSVGDRRNEDRRSGGMKHEVKISVGDRRDEVIKKSEQVNISRIDIEQISHDLSFEWIYYDNIEEQKDEDKVWNMKSEILFKLMADKTVVEIPPLIPFQLVSQNLDEEGRISYINVVIKSRVGSTERIIPATIFTDRSNAPLDIPKDKKFNMVKIEDILNIVQNGFNFISVSQYEYKNVGESTDTEGLSKKGLSKKSEGVKSMPEIEGMNVKSMPEIEGMKLKIIGISTIAEIKGNTVELLAGVWMGIDNVRTVFILSELSEIPEELRKYDILDPPTNLPRMIRNNLTKFKEMERKDVVLLNVVLHLLTSWRIDRIPNEFKNVLKITDNPEWYENIDIDLDTIKSLTISNNGQNFDVEYSRLSKHLPFLQDGYILVYSDKHLEKIEFFIDFVIQKCGPSYNKVNLLEDVVNFNFIGRKKGSLIFTDTTSFESWLFSETQRMEIHEGLTDELLRTDTINLSIREMDEGRMIDSLYILQKVFNTDVGMKVGKVWAEEGINIRYILDGYELENGPVDISDVGIINMALDTSRIPTMISTTRKNIKVKILTHAEDIFVMLKNV